MQIQLYQAEIKDILEKKNPKKSIQQDLNSSTEKSSRQQAQSTLFLKIYIKLRGE
jgi:hypothetical protein